MKRIIISVIVLLIIVGVGFFVFKQSQKPLQKSDLQNLQDNVESISSEGALLARESADKQITDNYKQTQVEYLSDQLKSTQKKLSSPAESDLANELTEQTTLANLSGNYLDQLKVAKEPIKAKTVQQNLTEIYQREEYLKTQQ